MQRMSGNGLSVPSVPRLVTAAMNPSTASTAFGNGIQTQIANSWNEIRRNAENFEFYYFLFGFQIKLRI
jgi:hypothetical protein